MSTFTGLYDIRDVKPSDNNFILATFLRSLYYGYDENSPYFRLIPKEIFWANYKPIAEAMVQPGRVTIKIACLKEEPDVILGYSILSNDFSTINFVYVKSAWRLRGIARALVPQYPTTVTHLTKVGQSLLTKFETPIIFNPFKT